MQNPIEIHFEVCVNCKNHAWCTHHDESKYRGLFVEMKAYFEANIPNVVCVMNKYTPNPGTGAFEITHDGKVIYSKKTTQLFPSTVPTCGRVKEFLEDLKKGVDVSKYAKTQEKKYEPPKQQKEKLTFETFKKQKEEELKRTQMQKSQQQDQTVNENDGQQADGQEQQPPAEDHEQSQSQDQHVDPAQQQPPEQPTHREDPPPEQKQEDQAQDQDQEQKEEQA